MKISSKAIPASIAVFLFAFGSFTSAGHASVIGDSMSLTYHYPNFSTTYIPFSASPNPFTAAIAVDTVGTLEGVTTFTTSFSTTGTTDTLTYLINTSLQSPTLNTATFNGPVLTVLSGSNFGAVLSVSGLINSSSLVVDTGSQVGINLAGVGYDSGDTISVTFGVSAVPLPASLPLFGAAVLGLGALGYGRRRTKRAAAAA